MAWQVIYKAANGQIVAAEEVNDASAANAAILAATTGQDWFDVGAIKVNKTLIATIEKHDLSTGDPAPSE